jgi:hypothetical protein
MQYVSCARGRLDVGAYSREPSPLPPVTRLHQCNMINAVYGASDGQAPAIDRRCNGFLNRCTVRRRIDKGLLREFEAARRRAARAAGSALPVRGGQAVGWTGVKSGRFSWGRHVSHRSTEHRDEALGDRCGGCVAVTGTAAWKVLVSS